MIRNAPIPPPRIRNYECNIKNGEVDTHCTLDCYILTDATLVSSLFNGASLDSNTMNSPPVIHSLRISYPGINLDFYDDIVDGVSSFLLKGAFTNCPHLKDLTIIRSSLDSICIKYKKSKISNRKMAQLTIEKASFSTSSNLIRSANTYMHDTTYLYLTKCRFEYDTNNNYKLDLSGLHKLYWLKLDTAILILKNRIKYFSN
jgi:hypothetical protein